MYTFSKTSLYNLRSIDLELRHLAELSITHSPHDFGIPRFGGKRSLEDQKLLYSKGRTKPGPRVTNCDGIVKKSYHQSGKAFDIAIYDEHGYCWKCIDKYKEVAEHIKITFDLMQKEGYFQGLKLEWGGTWNNPDYPHFQII